MKHGKESETIDVKVWREGKNVLVRCDKYHINTYGKSMRDAFRNLSDALSIHLGQKE